MGQSDREEKEFPAEGIVSFFFKKEAIKREVLEKSK